VLRIVLIAVFVLAGGALALWQFAGLELPFLPSRTQAAPRGPDLFAVVRAGDATTLHAYLQEGANVGLRDEYGQTPLMYAAGANGDPLILDMLMKSGADLNAQTDAGWTALMYAARDATDLEVPILLLNAGADPTLRNSDGQSAADLARSNPAMSTALYGRLRELESRPFDGNWPSGYTVPVEGATISSRASHLPGAPRPYRNGTHEGFDFYGGSVSVPIRYGTPIRAVASGTVIRADHDYREMTPEEYEQVIETARRSLNTPANILDRLRGRQVWVEHAGGFISRYAHLSAIPAGLTVGTRVSQGEVVGETGNSGTLEAAQGTEDDPHPHVEIWKDDVYLGQDLTPEQIYDLAAQVFGQSARPPYFGD
jgi:murein DD-endopeptidase MepM/ murein hydrolase activator NlpD